MSWQHQFPLRVYYGDTDAGGWVYHARYLEFFERARYECMAEIEFDVAGLARSGTNFAVAQVDVRYKRPARLGDRLLVESSLKEIGRGSLTLLQQIKDNNRETLFCTADIVLVCVDQNGRPKRIPPEVITKFEQTWPAAVRPA